MSCDTPADSCSSKNSVGFSMRYNLHVYHSFLGEAMEKGLRDCCRSIRIGKILIKIKDESKTPVVKQLIKVHDVI